MGTRETALLIHGYHWGASSDRAKIADGVELVSVQDTMIGEAYERLCNETGIDAGDPLDYEMALLIDAALQDERMIEVEDPYSVVSRFYSVLMLVGEEPSAAVRVMHSSDGFRSVEVTQSPYWSGRQTEFLQKRSPDIDDAAIGLTTHLWSRSVTQWQATRATGRIVNAMTYFGAAARAAYVDQVAINLAVALRSVFVATNLAASHSELPERIAWYASARGTDVRDECEMLRAFFALESRVHDGDPIVNDALTDIIAPTFQTTCRVLRRVLGEVDGVSFKRSIPCLN